jgi:hypothetical protein
MARCTNFPIDARSVNLSPPGLLSTRAAARDVWRGSKKASVSPLIQFLISARAMIGDLSKWEA